MSGTYLLARLKVKYGKVAEFSNIMEEMLPHAEAQGWTLVHSFSSIIGELTEVLDVWAVADANSVGATRAAFQSNPETVAIAGRLAEILVSEDLSLVRELPFVSSARRPDEVEQARTIESH